MPPIADILGDWRFEAGAAVFVLLIAGLYIAGVVSLHRRGERWPGWRTACFFVLGIGLFVWVEFGFLGYWATDLRWAFSTRIALLLFGVPGLMTLGKPVTLARRVLAHAPLKVVEAVLGSRVLRIMSNPIFTPLFALVVFLLLLTPLAAGLRTNPVSESLIPIVVPILGFILVLPLAGDAEISLKRIVALEFMLAFIELLLDALPGILMRLAPTVLDSLPRVAGTPGWIPNPLRDQQLAGDLLWLIAEVADVPILVLFLIHWMHTDRKESKSYDDLTDEQMDELMKAHLQGPR